MNRLSALLLLCACLVLPAFAEVRLALVIDQTNYQHTSELSRVTLASSEADQIEAALKDTGFKVTRHRDLTSTGLRDALDTFRLSLENAGPEAVGFLYYTGHGSQHPQTRNSYLLGTEARLRGASDLAAYGVPLETQKDAFAATGVKAIIMVFDACRNVAAGAGYKSGVKGFGLLEASADMLIAYSTDLNDVAAEVSMHRSSPKKSAARANRPKRCLPMCRERSRRTPAARSARGIIRVCTIRSVWRGAKLHFYQVTLYGVINSWALRLALPSPLIMSRL